MYGTFMILKTLTAAPKLTGSSVADELPARVFERGAPIVNQLEQLDDVDEIRAAIDALTVDELRDALFTNVLANMPVDADAAAEARLLLAPRAD